MSVASRAVECQVGRQQQFCGQIHRERGRRKCRQWCPAPKRPPRVDSTKVLSAPHACLDATVAERIGRLRGELEEVRTAHAKLESASGAAKEREAELRRLQGAIADRDAQLMALEGRAVAAERDQRDMRDAFAAARVHLEAVLRDPRVRSGSAGGELGEHVGELLRLLRRF